MTFSWDLNTGTLLALLVNLAMLIVFAVRTHGTANAALEKAGEAQKAVDETRVALGAHVAAFSLYREQIAERYVDRTALREMEQRLTASIENLGERLDQLLTRK